MLSRTDHVICITRSETSLDPNYLQESHLEELKS